jgi:signal transduction histidine kinase
MRCGAEHKNLPGLLSTHCHLKFAGAAIGMTEKTDLHKYLRSALAEEDLPRRSWAMRLAAAEPPAGVVIVGAVVLAVVISYVDWITGPDVRLGLFYVLPVALATWFAGRTAGYFLSLVVVLLWFTVGSRGGPAYSHPMLAYLTSVLRLGFFVSLVALLATVKDLSLRLRGLVEQRTRSLRLLGARLSQAEDSERRRLAHDLHDSLGQLITVIKLNLNDVCSRQTLDADTKQRIEQAIVVVDEVMQRSRALTFDLHPVSLERLGLVPALRRFGDRFHQQTGIEVTINEEGTARNLPTPAANYLFRSVKELMNNAARHGHAKQVVASIFWLPTNLRIVVDDDGSGFDISKAFAPELHSGLGLAAIYERMLSLGGTLRLETQPGSGTRVVMELPDHGPDDNT